MEERTYRVVVHLDESSPEKHQEVLRNITNLLNDLGPEQTQVELVTHGPGIDLLLQGSSFAEQVRQLQDRGVVMAVCHNTLRGRSIPEERVLPGATVVPAGIGELVRRQREGWQYVRP